jgi:hypothetical protein
MAKKSRRTRRSRPVGPKPLGRPVATGPQAAAPTATFQSPATGLKEDYGYVTADLRRIALFAGSIVAVLVALSFIIR